MRILIAAALALGGCLGTSAAPPSSIAESTNLDEKAGIGAEVAYKAARLAAELAVDAGRVKPGTALAARVAAADSRAYGALQSMRGAYRAGNPGSYARAIAEALAAADALRTAIEGAPS